MPRPRTGAARRVRQIAAGVLLSLSARASGAAVCTTTFNVAVSVDLATSSAGYVHALEYIDDGTNQLLAAGGEDQKLRVWTMTPLNTAPRVYKGHQEAIWSLVWISELSVLASSGGDGFIKFWPSSVIAVSQACSGLADCCDGGGLGCQGTQVISWMQTGMQIRRQCHSLAWISSGGTTGTLVSGWGDGSVRTWNYDGSTWTYGTNLQSDLWDKKDRIYDMAWLSGSSALATASPDWPHLRLWTNLTVADTYSELTKALGDGDGKGLCPWAHCDGVLAVVGNSDGTKLASASKDNTVILWSYSSKDRYAKLSSHTNYVTSLEWLHSESLIASGSADSTVLVWDATVTADTSTYGQQLTGHTGSVTALKWIPGLKKLVSADSAGTVKLWTC